MASDFVLAAVAAVVPALRLEPPRGLSQNPEVAAFGGYGSNEFKLGGCVWFYACTHACALAIGVCRHVMIPSGSSALSLTWIIPQSTTWGPVESRSSFEWLSCPVMFGRTLDIKIIKPYRASGFRIRFLPPTAEAPHSPRLEFRVEV